MDFTADLMWDGATRDHDAETLELARTAALADADALVGPLVFQASDANDLGHRLALAGPQLQAIADRRGYPSGELAADLKRRWTLLASARAAQAKQAAASRKVTAAQEEAMDQAVAGLAVMAARENPLVPMAECLRLATEAVQKHADAYPLAYESWGGTHDGPITDRAKKWKPPSLPGPAATGGNADPGMFDDVSQRLDDAESRVNQLAGPSRPSGPASPTASLDEMTAGFMDRVKNWWSGNGAEQTPAATSTPAAAPTPAPAAEGRAPRIAPLDDAASRHVDDAVTRHHDEQGRREFDDIMRGLDSAQDEMNHKWDTPRADRFESPSEISESNQHGINHRFDRMEQHLNDLGAPSGHSTPAGVPGGFSHTDTATSGGQQHLPTDPAASFSHPSTPDVPQQRQDSGVPVPSYFQHGVR